jgi:energy-coupling factor transporter ATP-binding protein EcfA2
MKDSSLLSNRRESSPIPGADLSWGGLRSPGLTPVFQEIRQLLLGLPKKHAVASYKQAAQQIWVLIIGGTGTGKSTIFNVLCGRKLSATGVERPKTCGPVLFGHRETVPEIGFPFPNLSLTRLDATQSALQVNTGAPGRLVFLEHDDPNLKGVILVDTPDLDSVETKNREMVEDLYLLADLIIFVTSQEKYADEVPHQFLEKVRREGKPFFLLVNKAHSELSAQELAVSLGTQGLSLPPDRMWLLPFIPLDAERSLMRDEVFVRFCGSFAHEISEQNQAALLHRERARVSQEIRTEVQRLIEALAVENEAARQWVETLDVFFAAACRKALEVQEKRLSEENRAAIQKEIRKHFSKYDLLGKPRRMVAQVILAPLRALGLVREESVESREETLRKMRERMDLLPIQAAMEGLSREVLEKLSPRDMDSPLYRELRRSELPLTRDEIRAAVWESQEELLQWLEQTFERLAQGIPRSKEIGIYSTSILWGGLILALEAAIGGGITLLEAVLDSAIAPFVTRGAVELFAYHELQKVGRQLATRYQESVKGVIRLQRDRYAACLESLLPTDEAVGNLRSLARELRR